MQRCQVAHSTFLAAFFNPSYQIRLINSLTWLWPPMEERACAYRILLPNQFHAALADGLFEVADGLEIGVDQRLVHELPKVFGGLHLGAVRGLEHEPDTVRHSQVFRPVPSGVIELQDDPLVCARARRFGEACPRESGDPQE